MSSHRRYQLFVAGEYLDSFTSFGDAVAAAKKFKQISVVDSHDGVVVYQDSEIK